MIVNPPMEDWKAWLEWKDDEENIEIRHLYILYESIINSLVQLEP